MLRRLRPSGLGSLGWLNFFLADVATGIGPFLAAFLAGRPGWSGTRIGVALSVASVAGLVVQTPIGAWVDTTRRKRALLAVSIVVIALASAAMILDDGFATVLAVQTLYGVAGAAIMAALTAITLGLVGRAAFAQTQARMQAWNHGGNVAAAIALGAIGKFGGLPAALCLLIALAAAALMALASIPAAAIDHRVARGAAADASPEAWYAPLRNRNMLALVGAFMLFHFANAAMLPLAGMKLGLVDPSNAAAYMAACIVGAQAIMVPVAASSGAIAKAIGWKTLLAVGFVVLALRGFLYPLSDATTWIIGVQLLDGVGAGLFGVLSVVAVEEITSGSGRFNAMQGLATTFVGIGASVSNAVAGWTVDRFGYGVAFSSLAVVALLATAVLVVFVRVPAAGAPNAAHSFRNRAEADGLERERT